MDAAPSYMGVNVATENQARGDEPSEASELLARSEWPRAGYPGSQ